MTWKRFVVPLLTLTLLIMALPLHATDPCRIPVGAFRTQTQGGWGGPSNSVPGGIRDANFASCFPGGLTVGGFYTIHLSTANDVRLYLPDGGTPNVLTQNYVNPGNSGTNSRNLGAQLTTLTLSMQFGICGVSGFHPMGALIIPHGVHLPAGAFAGWSVNQLVVLANTVLGGNPGALPSGISPSDLSDVLDSLNNNFDDGTRSNGYLVYPGCDHILAVEFLSFAAASREHAISVMWRTASEENVAFYEVSRRANGRWERVGTVAGLGNSSTGHSYEFTDENVTANASYDYRLLVHEVDGTVTVHEGVNSVVFTEATTPTDFALLQNYPNPFNPNTTIAFALPEAASVSLIVFDVTGRAVSTLVNGPQTAGTHSVNFDASHLSAGVYFYRLDAPNFSATRKLVLLK